MQEEEIIGAYAQADLRHKKTPHMMLDLVEEVESKILVQISHMVKDSYGGVREAVKQVLLLGQGVAILPKGQLIEFVEEYLICYE